MSRQEILLFHQQGSCLFLWTQLTTLDDRISLCNPSQVVLYMTRKKRPQRQTDTGRGIPTW